MRIATLVRDADAALASLDAVLVAECARPLCFEAPMTVSTAMGAACLLDAVKERRGIGALASLAIALANINGLYLDEHAMLAVEGRQSEVV